MLTHYFVLVVGLLSVFVGVSPLAVPLCTAATEPGNTAADKAQVKLWIKQLGSDDYAVREAATAKLVERGAAVLDAIGEIAADKKSEFDAELLWRAVHIVQQIAISGDIDLMDRSLSVLEQLRKSAPPGSRAILGSSAESLRDRFRVHAQQQIAELGGVISGSPLGGGLAVDLGRNYKGTDKQLRYLKVLGSINYLRLTGEKFNDASLDYLKEMSDLRLLHLTETAVTAKGQKALEKQIAGINILRFGAAVIGIAGETHDGHCLVQGVQPNSGAERGGLRTGDTITKLDGNEVKSFEDLVEMVAEKKVDQQVKVEVLRLGKSSEHVVTLTRRPAMPGQQIPNFALPPGQVLEVMPLR